MNVGRGRGRQTLSAHRSQHALSVGADDLHGWISGRLRGVLDARRHHRPRRCVDVLGVWRADLRELTEASLVARDAHDASVLTSMDRSLGAALDPLDTWSRRWQSRSPSG